jgi:MFS family permease
MKAISETPVDAKRIDTQLLDSAVDIKVKLAAVWAAVTLCYLYCDYFELYQPGKLQSMLAGRMGPLGESSQGVLLGVSVLLSIPALMVVLSALMPASVNRVANILFGVLFTLIMLVFLAAPGVWLYYKYFAAVEVTLTCCAVWLAWRWPKQQNTPPASNGAA